MHFDSNLSKFEIKILLLKGFITKKKKREGARMPPRLKLD